MSGHTHWRKLRDELRTKPGAEEAIDRARQESLDELRLYELRHAEAVSQAEPAGLLEVTQGAISKFEHADDRAGTSPHDQMITTIELYGTKVAPLVREQLARLRRADAPGMLTPWNAPACSCLAPSSSHRRDSAGCAWC